MSAFISPPARPPLLIRFGLWLVTRIAGRELLPARLLAWYPRAAFSSGVLEGLIAHRDGQLTPRLLKLVRLQTSFAVACPFCVDLNAVGRDAQGITLEELQALQGRTALEAVPSFSARERVALEYARLIAGTPLAFPPEFVARLTAAFDEREIVILASTAAQVNYFARLIQALGVPPLGVSDQCALPVPAAGRTAE
jgi:alkylhydroperoxidase family enzyme